MHIRIQNSFTGVKPFQGEFNPFYQTSAAVRGAHEKSNNLYMEEYKSLAAPLSIFISTMVKKIECKFSLRENAGELCSDGLSCAVQH